jgi:hypothetical protein
MAAIVVRPGRASLGASGKFFNFVGLDQGKRIVFNKNFFNNMADQLQAISDGLSGLKAGQQISLMIAKLAGASIKKNFKNQKNRSQTRWKALARSTKLERKRLGFPMHRPILIRSGNLFIAATEGLGVKPQTRGKPFLTIFPQKFRQTTYGHKTVSSRVYFDMHNEGGFVENTNRLTKIPKRNFFYIRRKDAVLIGDLLVAIAFRRASAVSRRRKSDEISAPFSHRMASLNLSHKDFLSDAVLNKATRQAMSRVARGLE